MESDKNINSDEGKINSQQEPELNPTMSPVQAAYFGLVAVFFLYQIGGGILTLIIFGTDYQNADINALRLMTMAGQVLLILLPGLVFTKLIYDDVTTAIRFRMPDWKILLLFIGGLVLLTPLLQSMINIQNYIIDQLASISTMFAKFKEFFDMLDGLVEKTYADLLSASNIAEMLFVIFIVSVVPAICEELFFRGFVFRSFELKYKKITAAILTGIFFSLYHFNPYGMIGLFALGVYFGIAAYVSNSIFVPVILHFLNNLTAVIFYFIYGSDELVSNKVPPPDDITFHLVSFISLLILFVTFVYYVMKYSKNRKGVLK